MNYLTLDIIVMCFLTLYYYYVKEHYLNLGIENEQ